MQDYSQLVAGVQWRGRARGVGPTAGEGCAQSTCGQVPAMHFFASPIIKSATDLLVYAA